MERIIFTEDATAIEKARSNFELQAQKLNDLHAITPITSEEYFQEIHKDPTGWIHGQMRKEKKVRELEAHIAIEQMKKPEHFAKAASLALEPIEFSVLHFDGATWEVDPIAFEIYCDKFREVLAEPDQIARYKLSVQFSELMEKIIAASEFEKPEKIYHLPGFMENVVRTDPSKKMTFTLSSRFVRQGRVSESF
jgi:hypothetical protein